MLNLGVVVNRNVLAPIDCAAWFERLSPCSCRQVRGLEWDPFCPNNLATGGADGMIKVWSIPTNGLQADLTDPLVSLHTSELHEHERVVSVYLYVV